MGEKVDRTGKNVRPKTAERGKRYLCAKCRKRSPRPVYGPALVLPEVLTDDRSTADRLAVPQLDPCRRVVARLLPPADVPIDTRRGQPLSRRWVEQQVVDP
jgi:hypothetical protein